jgi:hypothetical protein
MSYKYKKSLTHFSVNQALYIEVPLTCLPKSMKANYQERTGRLESNQHAYCFAFIVIKQRSLRKLLPRPLFRNFSCFRASDLLSKSLQ